MVLDIDEFGIFEENRIPVDTIASAAHTVSTKYVVSIIKKQTKKK